MTERVRLALDVASRQLIEDLHLVLRCAASMAEFKTITDPHIAEGFDFSYWADECEKVLCYPAKVQPFASRVRLSPNPDRVASAWLEG